MSPTATGTGTGTPLMLMLAWPVPVVVIRQRFVFPLSNMMATVGMVVPVVDTATAMAPAADPATSQNNTLIGHNAVSVWYIISNLLLMNRNCKSCIKAHNK